MRHRRPRVIYTGRDLPPGTYDGAVRLTAGAWSRDVPIELELFDFALPDATMRAMIYVEPSRSSSIRARTWRTAFIAWRTATASSS